MAISKQIRSFHKWGGIIFLIPALIISITAILLALNGVFHFDRIRINYPFLGTTNNTEVKVAIKVSGKHIIGTKTGLFILDNESCIVVPELSGFDIKSLLAINDTVFIGTKQGLFRYSDNSVIQIFSGDIFNISRTGEEYIMLSLGKEGIRIIDFNGNENRSLNLTMAVKKNLELLSYGQPQTLHKLIVDIHTGEAIVGKTLKNYWIFLGGTGLLLISITGLWLILGKKKKRLFPSYP